MEPEVSQEPELPARPLCCEAPAPSPTAAPVTALALWQCPGTQRVRLLHTNAQRLASQIYGSALLANTQWRKEYSGKALAAQWRNTALISTRALISGRALVSTRAYILFPSVLICSLFLRYIKHLFEFYLLSGWNYITLVNRSVVQLKM